MLQQSDQAAKRRRRTDSPTALGKAVGSSTATLQTNRTDEITPLVWVLTSVVCFSKLTTAVFDLMKMTVHGPPLDFLQTPFSFSGFQ